MSTTCLNRLWRFGLTVYLDRLNCTSVPKPNFYHPFDITASSLHFAIMIMPLTLDSSVIFDLSNMSLHQSLACSTDLSLDLKHWLQEEIYFSFCNLAAIFLFRSFHTANFGSKSTGHDGIMMDNASPGCSKHATSPKYSRRYNF